MSDFSIQNSPCAICAGPSLEPYPATVEGQDCCSTSSTTSTRAFLEILRATKPDQRLVFRLDEAPLVAAG
jgi:hypothetical protein